MRSFSWGLYQLAVGLALLVTGPFLLLRRGSHYLPTLPGRLGRGKAAAGGRGGLWLAAGAARGGPAPPSRPRRQRPGERPELPAHAPPAPAPRTAAVGDRPLRRA